MEEKQRKSLNRRIVGEVLRGLLQTNKPYTALQKP
jgi:hypothetical protein